jgi:anti-anti-sigma factor
LELGRITVEHTDGESVRIALAGEFDLSNVREVEAAAYDSLGPEVRKVCVDLHEVTFMDSSMLNLLVNLRKRLLQRRGELVIQPSIRIAELLEISGLGGLFDLVDPSPGPPE